MFKVALGRDLLLISRDYVSIFPDTKYEVLIERDPFIVRLAWLEPRPAPRPIGKMRPEKTRVVRAGKPRRAKKGRRAVARR